MEPFILWVNHTGASAVPTLCSRLGSHCQVHCCDGTKPLAEQIARLKPNVICFDFNEPDAAQRALVQSCRINYPSLPVLLFTTTHSTELLVWALRTRIWDCFIKPVSCGEVLRRLNILLPALSDVAGQHGRKLLLPDRSACAQSPLKQSSAGQPRTAAALPYLQQHFHEKIISFDVARLCAMDPFAFSRAFRREQGTTFRDYLMRLRIESAAAQLRTSDKSIVDVGCSVGFNDPSQFARLFRRHMGVTPTAYRSSVRAACAQAAREVAAG